MKRYLVFLDIDGVLTSTRVQLAQDFDYNVWAKFDPVAVDFFNKLYLRYENVEFVVMSTWRQGVGDQGSHRRQYHWVESAFRNAGFMGKFAQEWKTPNTGKDRAYDVKKYLEDNGDDVDDYLLFDDTQYMFNTVLDKKRFVRTDPDNGLLAQNMKNALAMTGTWNYK